MTYVYLCDGTTDGIFTGIYEAWSSKYGHKNIRLEIEEEIRQPELFCEYIQVDTDGEKAEKVAAAIEKKISREAYEMVYRSTLSGKIGRADEIYRFLLWGFFVGRSVLEQLGHPYVRPLFERNRSVVRELQHYQGFLRFSELSDGILFSEIRPGNAILPLLGEHFSDRLSGENWIIYEAGRKQAAFHKKELPYVLVHGLEKEELLEKLKTRQISEKEEYLQELWKEFVDTIGIKERKNEKLQKQLLPLRYREFMKEYNA